MCRLCAANLDMTPVVSVQGVVSRPELNGRTGRLLGLSADAERVVVRLDGDGLHLSLKKSSVVVHADTTQDMTTAQGDANMLTLTCDDMPTFEPLEKERLDLFARAFRARVHEEDQELHAAIESRLLAIGGVGMVPMALAEVGKERMLQDGCLFSLPIRRRPGAPSSCHQNVAGLLVRTLLAMPGGPGETCPIKFCTGYALCTVDGVWRQHSWALEQDTGDHSWFIVETTPGRSCPWCRYWGVQLSDDGDMVTDETCRMLFEERPDDIPEADFARAMSKMRMRVAAATSPEVIASMMMS